MQTLSCKEELQIINLKWLFSLANCQSFFKINRVQAIDEVDKLCKFHENQTKIVDFIAEQEKDEWTDRGRKPSHNKSSAGFQPVKLKTVWGKKQMLAVSIFSFS